MKKRINERTEDTKKYTFDTVYCCDGCGKEYGRSLKIHFGLPPHSMLFEGPEFCSKECLKIFFLGNSELMQEMEKDVKHYRGDPDDDREEKWEGGIWMPLEFWKELFK